MRWISKLTIAIFVSSCSSLTFADNYDFNSHISGNADFVSNYVWRGVTQNSDNPALELGVNYNFDSGFYVGLWGANVNLTDVNGKTVPLELDGTAGYAQNFKNGFGYNLDVYRYNYPNASGLNYNEYSVSAIYKILTATVAYSDNEYASNHSGEYYNLAVDYDIPDNLIYHVKGIGVGASIGRSILPVQAGNDYTDYKVYISKALTQKLKFILSYTNTDGILGTPSMDKSYIIGDLSLAF